MPGDSEGQVSLVCAVPGVFATPGRDITLILFLTLQYREGG